MVWCAAELVPSGTLARIAGKCLADIEGAVTLGLAGSPPATAADSVVHVSGGEGCILPVVHDELLGRGENVGGIVLGGVV